MPHLTIQHSQALAERHDMSMLCNQLRQVMIAEGCFPVGGIRVRAWPTPAQSIADGHPDNTYADLVLRMGAGRSMDVKRAAGVSIMSAAEAFFADDLAGGYFALAFEIVEIDPELSWKTNSIHARLKAEDQS
jgi:5-carboxymethyl-2-hydroxymuconate isomerase